MSIPVLTIDGPSGSGKGTISRRLAGIFGWHLLDSGALYRLSALASRQAGIALDDPDRVSAVAAAMVVSFSSDAQGEELIYLNKHDVTGDIRSESCGEDASKVAVIPALRDALLEVQKSFRKPPGLVADGRDMGTVVFPDAELKVFLTASAGERADRRYKQLKDKGIDVSLPALLSDIERRDARDASREVAPLVAAEGALVVDSTGRSIDEVVSEIIDFKNRCFGIGS